MRLTKRQVAPVLDALGYGDYAGRKISLVQQGEYVVFNGDLQWEGGSKREVHFLRRGADGTWSTCDAASVVGWGRSATSVGGRIPDGLVVVERSWHRSVDCGVRFVVGCGEAARSLTSGEICIDTRLLAA